MHMASSTYVWDLMFFSCLMKQIKNTALTAIATRNRHLLVKQASIDRLSSQLKSGVSAPKSTLEDKIWRGSFASL